MAAAISSIANNGKYCTSHVVGTDKLLGIDKTCSEIGIDQENLDLVKKGMQGACSQGGTGYTFFDFNQKTGKDLGCKTGTAEDIGGEPHAWFVAYAPLDSPEIITTVMIENGGEGSKVAGPIAREIFNYWFNIQPSLTPQPAHDR